MQLIMMFDFKFTLYYKNTVGQDEGTDMWIDIVTDMKPGSEDRPLAEEKDGQPVKKVLKGGSSLSLTTSLLLVNPSC